METPDRIRPIMTHYNTVRRAIGVLAILLPFLLALIEWFVFGKGLQRSISYYYRTEMCDVLVGSLCAIGVLLLVYRGYERPTGEKGLSDNALGNLGCVFAIGAALFPEKPVENAVPIQVLFAVAHWILIVFFFATVIAFALLRFPRSRHLARNRIYRICASTMVLCMVLIAVFQIPSLEAAGRHLKPLFWLQAIAFEAFGVSWIVKGRIERMALRGRDL